MDSGSQLSRMLYRSYLVSGSQLSRLLSSDAGTLGWSDPVSHDCGSFVECGPTIMPHSPAKSIFRLHVISSAHTHTLSLSLLHQALFAATHFYTNQLLHKSDFTPKRFNTNQLFDKPPFTQTTLYTNQPLLWACRPKARGAGGMPKAVKQLFPCIPCHVVTMWKTPSALSVCVPIWSSQPLGAATQQN